MGRLVAAGILANDRSERTRRSERRLDLRLAGYFVGRLVRVVLTSCIIGSVLVKVRGIARGVFRAS